MTSNDATHSTGALLPTFSQSSNYLRDTPLTERPYNSIAAHMETEGTVQDPNSVDPTSIGQVEGEA